jgi:Family of unknown function (DUF6520)
MKKIKWTILTFVILFSIGAAFATRPHLKQTIYYFNGSEYLIAGVMGENYVCVQSSSTCTYTYSGGVYTPYMNDASYTPIGMTTEKAKSKPNEKKGN